MMPTYEQFYGEAKSNGYSDDEIQRFVGEKRAAAKQEGYTDSQINDYLGIPNSDAKIKQHFDQSIKTAQAAQPEKAVTFTDAIEAGWQVSTTALAARGKMPDKQLAEDAPWYNRIAASAATMAGDVPAMVGGALLGGGSTLETGPGAAIGAMAGAFALPAGLRAVMIDAYTKGEFATPREFLERASGIMLDTAKGYITGAATGGAGLAAGAALKTATPAVAEAGKVASEIATMVTVSKGLEGELPHASDFGDAAVLLFGAKAAVKGAAKLKDIYVQTGRTPTQVAEDVKRDPTILPELVSNGKEVPKAYAEMVEPKPEPKVLKLFHGTAHDFVEFRPSEHHGGTISLAWDANRAGEYASGSAFLLNEVARKQGGPQTAQPKVIPVSVELNKVFSPSNEGHVSEVARSLEDAGVALDSKAYPTWEAALKAGQDDIMETPSVVAALKRTGFDGAYINDGGSGAVNVFDPAKITRLDMPPKPKAKPEPEPAKEPANGLQTEGQKTPEEVILSKINKDGTPANKTTFNEFYSKFIDDLDPIARMEESITGKKVSDLPAADSAYKMFRLSRGSFGRASHFLEFGPVDFNTYAKTGEGLKQILEPHGKELDSFRAYAVSRRATELEQRGITSGMDVEAAKAVVAEGGRFGEAFGKLVKYQDSLTQYLKDSGILSEEAYGAMRQANKDYVPFYRLMEDGSKAAIAGRGNTPRNPIKGIKGSEREVLDPIESIIKNTYLYVTLAERNAASLKMVDVAVPEGIATKVKTGMKPVEVTDKEVAKFLTEHGMDSSMAEAFTIFRPNHKNIAPDEVLVFRAGKRELYAVPEEVATAVKALDKESIGLWMKILAIPAKTLRAGAVLSPDFMARNVMRDQVGAFVFSKDGYIPFLDFARGAFSVAKQDAIYQDWLKSGGANAAMVAVDRNYIQQHVFKLDTDTGFAQQAWNVAKSPVEMLRIASELMENATRVGEFKRATGGATDKATLMEGGYQSREVTLDFARAGSQGKAINMVVAFFNAQVQGVDRTARAFTENPVGTSAKIAAGITLPSVLLWMANNDDPRWQEIPQWQKDMFWIVLTKDTVYRIPKPFELGLIFGSGVERALDYAKTRDPKMAERFLLTVAEGLAPSAIPTIAAPLAEQWANRSLFTGAPIIPADKEKLLPELRYNDGTSELTKALGHMLGTVPKVQNMSLAAPAVIDNYIRGWTGGLGTYAVQIADNVLRKAGVLPDPIKPDWTLADVPAVKAFVVRYPSAQAQSIVDFREEYQKRKMAFESIQYLAKQGNPEAAVMLMTSRPDAFAKLDGIQNAMSESTRFIHLINQMDEKDATSERRSQIAIEKRQLIDAAYYQMIQMTQAGNQLMKEIDASLKR